MSARYIVGDVFDVLATLEDNSVDLIMSSPPFLALRSYLPADHEHKHKEIGSEATPADFLDTLLDVVEACDRVLAPHGSLCFELGDTFAGSGGAGGDYNEGGMREGQPRFRAGDDRRDGRRTLQAEDYAAPLPGPRGNNGRASMVDAAPGGHHLGGYGWPDAKSLCGIPTLFAWSLAYGRNLLRPERETPRWRIRNLVVWARPNPPVGALGDKFRPATSYLTVATKSRTRYFDLDAVRGPGSENTHARLAKGAEPRENSGKPAAEERGGGWSTLKVADSNGTAPPLDYWVIPTAPYAGSHYATFPPDLCVRPIKAMSPARVCRVCGEPSRRIVESTYVTDPDDSTRDELRPNDSSIAGGLDHPPEIGWERNHETLGWTDCGHDDYRSGCVLDPFAGSGTTLAVATGHGRDAVGIDIDHRNAGLALERVGPMFLTIEHPVLDTEGAP